MERERAKGRAVRRCRGRMGAEMDRDGGCEVVGKQAAEQYGGCKCCAALWVYPAMI